MECDRYPNRSGRGRRGCLEGEDEGGGDEEVGSVGSVTDGGIRLGQCARASRRRLEVGLPLVHVRSL